MYNTIRDSWDSDSGGVDAKHIAINGTSQHKTSPKSKSSSKHTHPMQGFPRRIAAKRDCILSNTRRTHSCVIVHQPTS
jgi:hypothetical protein